MSSAGGRPRVPHGGSKGRKERDEDLLLFREMFKRERERNVSLLQPVSDEFEPSLVNGSHPLYKIPTGKKGGGSDFLTAESEKNDYDWLKTPPATPLFPSLEMEANDPSMVFHKELPLLKTLKPSRFLERPEEAQNARTPKSPSSARSATSTSSSRSVTPSTRPASSTGKANNLRPPTSTIGRQAQPSLMISWNINKSNTASTMLPARKTAAPKIKQNPETKPRSRGVSPLVRSRIPATLPGFSDEAPPNLLTSVAPGRASSATRGRPAVSLNSTSGAAESKVEVGKHRRQSCSPGATRGRRVESGEEQKWAGKAGNGTLVVGSRMVEKVMNARRSGIGEERDSRANGRNSSNEVPGFGRLMTRASLDVAHKHMEVRKNSNSNSNANSNGPPQGNATRNTMRSITPSGSKLSTQTSSSYDVRDFRGRATTENRQLISKGESTGIYRCGLC